MKHQPTRLIKTTTQRHSRNKLTINAHPIDFIVISAHGMAARKGLPYQRIATILMQDIFLDEPVANGKTGELDIIRNTQLFKQTVAVGAGCFRAKTKLRRYLLV